MTSRLISQQSDVKLNNNTMYKKINNIKMVLTAKINRDNGTSKFIKFHNIF